MAQLVLSVQSAKLPTLFKLENNVKIDTSTTAGKIVVMQAFDDGKQIQCMLNCEEIIWVDFNNAGRAIWNWEKFKYRVKPETVEDASLEYVKDIFTPTCYEVRDGFKAGAKWQKEQGQ